MAKMTAALILASFFLMLILIIAITLALSLKTWVYKKDEVNEKRFQVLKERIDETQSLFKNEVTEILQNVRKILK